MHIKQELCRQTMTISELSRAFVQRDRSGSAAHASGNPPRSPGSCCWAADFGTWNQKGDDRNENAHKQSATVLGRRCSQRPHSGHRRHMQTAGMFHFI